jgi:hypothetical protein
MSQKSVKFSRDTNEINQSNAKTDAPKTVSCLKMEKPENIIASKLVF